MTNNKLNEILDNPKKTISLEELKHIIYELKNDVAGELNQNISLETMRYYCGEINAFFIVLDLIEHLEVKK